MLKIKCIRGATLNLITEKLTIAEKIRLNNGLSALVLAGLRFLVKPFYARDLYYLYEKPLDLSAIEAKVAKNQSGINIPDLNFKVVTSNQEAEQLEKEGFVFRSYPTDFNLNHTRYTLLLDYGMIAFCTFVGKEFAAISWIIPSKKTQGKMKAPPLKVNYNSEVFVMGIWCHPKYRGQGLHSYNSNNLNLYLARRGTKKLRGATVYKKTIQAMVEARGSIQCGQAFYTKILVWRFWEERPAVLPLERRKRKLSQLANYHSPD